MNATPRFEGKVALVTGASSGVGRATCKLFAQEGAQVVGVARRAELGNELEKEIRDSGGEFTFVQGDVSKVEDCERAVAAAIDGYKRLDFLVNNAATHARQQFIPTHRVTEDDWDLVVDTALKGTFFCCRFALEHMKRQKFGVIVNVSSLNAVKPTAGMAAYNSAKAAILQLSRTIAVEYHHHNIRSTAITLGGTDTPKAYEGSEAIGRLTMGADAPAAEPGDFAAILLSAEQVARAIALLCEDDAEVFYGAVVPVDGGMTVAMDSGGAYAGIDIAGALDKLDSDPDQEA